MTCGGGARRRRRRCLNENGPELSCLGRDEDEQYCNGVVSKQQSLQQDFNFTMCAAFYHHANSEISAFFFLRSKFMLVH